MLGTEGLKRIVNSAKVQLLAVAAFGATTIYLLTPGTSLEKRDLLTKMVYTLGALVGAVILGWAHEDAALKRGASQQVNVGSEVTNQPAVPPTTSVTADPLAGQTQQT